VYRRAFTLLPTERARRMEEQVLKQPEVAPHCGLAEILEHVAQVVLTNAVHWNARKTRLGNIGERVWECFLGRGGAS
jgi:hypothetical protein